MWSNTGSQESIENQNSFLSLMPQDVLVSNSGSPTVSHTNTHIYVHTPLAELLTPCHHLYWPKVQQAGQMTEAKEQANQSTSNDAGVTDGTDGPVCFLNCHQTPI